ncbi:MAG: inositol monophosphatase [Nitrospinaceae bacterium]|nr:inositol monophosphatase [Nitrospinaceae bacterium]MBT3433941.1 inositol monophosphatase [Nitrospinaceae bacterium]MBT4093405.1 inositol monophosphatase [Nitrospinaceae bacterium]MBT5948628.1 inositol monophosphatase [Nitrospinaceae bacterium]MBT6395416.1 inositol monophosphatase [Nitrospinaceae bacterium]
MALRAFLEDVAREAGGVALGFFGKVETEHKGTSIVSEADRAAERLILSRIKAEFPGEYILAEESGASGDDPIGDDTCWWAVDPIDGTLAYLSNLPFWAVSVARMLGGRVVGGAIYVPALGEMYSAVSGGAAHKNGAPLDLLSGEPPGDHTPLFVPCSEIEALDIRFPGKRLSVAAIAVHLLYAATGSAYGVVSEPTRAYDIAAADLILECVGGAVRYLSGEKIDYAMIADGRRSPEPVVAAASGQVDWLRGQVSWSGD